MKGVGDRAAKPTAGRHQGPGGERQGDLGLRPYGGRPIYTPILGKQNLIQKIDYTKVDKGKVRPGIRLRLRLRQLHVLDRQRLQHREDRAQGAERLQGLPQLQGTSGQARDVQVACSGPLEGGADRLPAPIP